MIFRCLLGLCLFCIGCGGVAGPDLQTVTGKVTKGGKPLTGVTVTFSPVGPGPSSGGITNDEGKFVLLCQSGKAGAVVGKHKAVLMMSEAPSSAPVGMEAMMAARKASESKGSRGAPAKSTAVASFPPEYANPQDTPLAYEVKAGANDFDIVIP